MADKRDCYEILGIDKSASADDIKRAFRQMAKKYHPDANPGDKAAEEKFKEVNEAYSILSDPDKKARYDSYGYAGVDPNAAGGFGNGFGGFSGDFDLGDLFGGVFGNMFGGGRTSTRNPNAPTQGDDVGARVTVDFMEAIFGCKRDVSFSRVENCADCGGSGAAKGTTASRCTRCNGTGRITVQRRTPFGVMQSTAACDECGGTGKKITNPCKTCRGNGSVRKSKQLEVNIPAGIDNGQRIVLHNQGDAGRNGGPSGDLIIQVSVRSHELYKREGFDLYYELPISFSDAALGAKLSVPTPDGKAELNIPEGTQTGSTFSIRGKGVTKLNGRGRGDLYITVKVETPKGLSRKQKELLKDLEDDSEKIYAKRKQFNDRNK